MLGKLRKLLDQHRACWWPDARTRRFLAYNRRKWPRRAPGKDAPTVLVGLFTIAPVIYCYSYAANHLARLHDATIETFSFLPSATPLLQRIYSSFGARHGLGIRDLKPYRKRAVAEAAELFGQLTSKLDVENLTVDGVMIGDLIYDTYLRRYAEVTLDIADPRLREVITEALAIFHATREYLVRRKPVAVLPDHLVYIDCGIVVRLAVLAGIPVYCTYFAPRFYLMRLTTAQDDPRIRYPVRWPYWQFPELFRNLDPIVQQEAMLEARAALTARLTGALDQSLPGLSAYEAARATRILSTSAKPKILIMLHDFCDAIHGYRDFLFPDFFEWIHFLLERAVQTDFEWYVKPHPNNRQNKRAAMNAANDAIVAKLQVQYPSVTFLDAAVSNRQLIDEGLTSMFTGRGTAGHEFAYLGVPVVNAGDNPHVAYRFNINPSTREELADCIRKADKLEVQIDQREIEEFFYMRYLYFRDHHGTDANPINQSIPLNAGSQAALLDQFRNTSSPEKDRQIAAYFDRLINPSDRAVSLAPTHSPNTHLS